MKNILSSKIFFVNWQNNIPKNEENFINYPFIGVLDNDNNNIIYFYCLNNNKYIFEFLIIFIEGEKIYEELVKYIKPLGIGEYLCEMGIPFSNYKNPFCLINRDLQIIGKFINYNKNNKYIWRPEYPKNIEYIDSSHFCKVVLHCLVNIQPLLFLLLDRKKLNKIINKNCIYTKIIYEIFQDLWYWNDENNEFNQNNVYNKLINEIKKEHELNILQNIKSLIEFLLLKIHNELKIDKSGQRNYNNPLKLDEKYKNPKDMDNKLFDLENSVIQQLFLFELEKRFFCSNCNKEINYEYYIKCTLEFDIEQISYIFKEEHIININNILKSLDEDMYCKCGQIKTILYPVSIGLVCLSNQY